MVCKRFSGRKRKKKRVSKSTNYDLRGARGLFGRETLYLYRRETKTAYKDRFKPKMMESMKMTFYLKFLSDNREVDFWSKSNFS